MSEEKKVQPVLLLFLFESCSSLTDVKNLMLTKRAFRDFWVRRPETWRYTVLCNAAVRSKGESAIRVLLGSNLKFMNEKCYSGEHMSAVMRRPVSDAEAHRMVLKAYVDRFGARETFFGLVGQRKLTPYQRKMKQRRIQ